MSPARPSRTKRRYDVCAATDRDTCPECASLLRPHTERTPTCTVCLRWGSMRARARRRGEDFDLTLADFAAWMAEQEDACTYCGVDESDLRLLGVLNQTGAHVTRLGVDRLDGDTGYVPSNMTPACFVCNRTKSDWYTPDEMHILGEGIAKVWEARLGRCSQVRPARRTRHRAPRPCTRTGERACRSCDAPFEAHTPGTPLCTVCVRFRSLRGNARRVRRDGTNPELSWDLHGFAAWFEQQERACTYCGVDETTLPLLNLPTQVGRALQRLGVDRLDPARGYDATNTALCCLACNRIRSATFSPAEMRVIAPSVERLWARRLEGARP